MTGRATGRASSRRAASQSSPIPARNTRSKSHEAFKNGQTKPNTRDNARGGVSVESNGGTTPWKGPKASGKKRGRPVKDLSSVEEASSGLDEVNVNPQATQAFGSPADISNISGTTAITSHSALALAEIDSEKMISKLTDLSDVSGKVLDLLTPRNASDQDLDKLIRDLQDPTSRRARHFRNLRSAFTEVRREYGAGAYIDLSTTIRGMLGVRYPSEVGEGLWRPDDIFYKSNLATFIDILWSLQDSFDSTVHPLEKLDRDFPKPFLERLAGITSHQSLGSSTLLKDSFDVALDIRTQFTLQTLKDKQGNANFDPSIVLNQIFYEIDRPTSIRDWAVGGLRQTDFKREKRNAIVERMQQIQAHFRHDSDAVKSGSTVDIDGLYAEFPLFQFVQKALIWTRRRADEIEKSLHNVGHTIDLQENLDAEIRRRQTISFGEAPIALEKNRTEVLQLIKTVTSESLLDQGHESSRQNSNPSLNNLVVARHLRQRAAHDLTPGSKLRTQLSIIKKTAPSSAGAATSGIPVDTNIGKSVSASAPAKNSDIAESGLYPEFPYTSGIPRLFDGGNDIQIDEDSPELPSRSNDDEDVGPSLRPQDSQLLTAEERRDIIESHRALEAEQDKENNPELAVSHVQRGKRRLIDPQPDAVRLEWDHTQTLGGGNLPRSTPPGTQHKEMSDPSEDEGFLQDAEELPPIIRNKKRSALEKPALQSPKRVHRSQSASINPRRATRSRIDDNDDEEEGETLFKQVSRQAKKLTMQKNNTKPPQTRKPWTTSEENTLQELIEEHGTSWALVKDKDQKGNQILVNRDQVALKDKARNMKFLFMKTNVTLPRNFDRIPLKQSQKDMLRNDHGVGLSVEDEG